MRRFRQFAATTILLVAANAFAANTDTVVLRNGDRISGEVKELSVGQLKFSTDDAGTIYIEWDKIASITTAGQYEVTTQDGSHYVGTLGPDVAETIAVTEVDGAVWHLRILDVVVLRRIRTGFFERIDGSFDLGGSYTQSSGVGQLSVGLEVVHRRPLHELFANYESNLTGQEAEPTTLRFTLRSGYTNFRRNHWFLTPFAFVERNPDLGLTLRTIGAFAVGRVLHQSNRAQTLVAGGIAGGSERPVEGDITLNVDAVVSFATTFSRYDYPKKSVSIGLLLFPELNHWGRVRANTSVKFKYELLRDFIAAASMYNTFDNQPPVADANHNDVGVTFSLGWTF